MLIKVNLRKKSYDIVTGYGAINQLPKHIKALKLGNAALIITNPKIKKIVGTKLTLILKKSGISFQFVTVPDTEKSKSPATAFKLISKVSKYAKLKRLFVIALGGGVIGDLGGFVASVYKRGIPYIQIPTTLLAQVDSAIGGKVGIDLDCGKNMVGAFYQPRLVLCDISFLSSLPRKQIRSGLSEIVKYGVIKDGRLFSYIEKNHHGILKLKKTNLIHIINRCVQIKANVVSKDEKETKGIRTILNFGHTIGHAIEAAGDFKSYNHGEAVGLGMIAAAKIACDTGILKNKEVIQRIAGLLKLIGLPVRMKGLNINKILKAQSFDKKFIHGRNRFVLPKRIGEVTVKEGIQESVIRKAVKELIYLTSA